MMMRAIFVAVIAFAFFAMVGRADAAGLAMHYEKSIPAGQGFGVNVTEDIWATVRVTGGKEHTVTVVATTSGPYADRVRYYEVVQGNTRTLKFYVQKPPGMTMFGWFGEMLPRALIEIRVPQALATSVDATKGHVTVDGVTGPLTVSLVLGGINARAAGDVLQLSTVNGMIEAEIAVLSSRPSIDVSTVNGSINVIAPPALQSPVDASTVNGAVRNSLRGSRGPGKIALDTVNGDVTIGPR